MRMGFASKFPCSPAALHREQEDETAVNLLDYTGAVVDLKSCGNPWIFVQILIQAMRK
jgi:hypothetical protein